MQEGDKGLTVFQKTFLPLMKLHILLFKLLDFLLELLIFFSLVLKEGNHSFPVNLVSHLNIKIIMSEE